MREKIVGIMGSGKIEHQELSIPLGKMLADKGYNILTGGGRGVMEAVCRSYASISNRKGKIIGVIPTEINEEGLWIEKKGYPNQFVEITVMGPLGTFEGIDPDQISRNHINILCSDVIVALPGSKGTNNEIELAKKIGKPIILFGPEEWVERNDCLGTSDLKKVIEFIETHL